MTYLRSYMILKGSGGLLTEALIIVTLEMTIFIHY